MQADTSWAQARIAAIRDLTPTVREFTLQPEAAPPAPYEPGSHLQVQVLVDGRPQVRSYSVVSCDVDGWRIAVKRLDAGRGGSLAMWRLAVGDRLPVCGPQNHFALAWHAPQYLLVAGGIGITPIAGMAQALAARGAHVRLLYAARDDAELAYADVLQAALSDALHTHAGRRIDLAAEIARLVPGAQLYLCGPQSLLDDARRAWAAAGRPPADLRFETFGSSGQYAPQAFRVQVPRHALDITVPAGCSLLDALEGAGVQALSDCRRGECGLCAMDVLAVDGQIDHRDVYLSAHERQANSRICACVSRVVGSVTLDTAWRPD